MNRGRWVVALVSVAALACASVGGRTSGEAGDATAELSALERQMLAAELRGDSSFFRRLEVPEFSFVGWRGEVMNRDADVRASGAPARDIVASAVDDLTVRGYDRTAVVVGRISLTRRSASGAAGAGDVTRSRFTHVFVRRGSDWALVASQSARIP